MAREPSTPRKTVFVSYAHEDRKWVDELLAHLAPWIREKRVDLWDDSRMEFGTNWRPEIQAAMQQAAVAVLLVTKDFLSSDFIWKEELPFLLERASARRIRLAWIAVGHTNVEATPLAQFQAINDPNRPLEELRGPQRDKVLADVARKIADAVTLRTLAGGLEIMDQTTEPLEAAVEGRREKPGRKFDVQAQYEPSQDQISFRGTNETITAADLDRLPLEDREFIDDLDDSLARNYKRWVEVRKRLGAAGGALDDEVVKELRRIEGLMCADLRAVVGFIEDMHKVRLQDHYRRYRFICDKLTTR